MSHVIVNSGPSLLLDDRIRIYLREAKPKVVGIVSAFVSVSGVTKFAKAMSRLRIAECRLVAGTSHYITHPEALVKAQNLGWKVRFGKLPPTPGIFHPKVIIAGNAFHHRKVVNPCFVCIGSANLTRRGLSESTALVMTTSSLKPASLKTTRMISGFSSCLRAAMPSTVLSEILSARQTTSAPAPMI